MNLKKINRVKRIRKARNIRHNNVPEGLKVSSYDMGRPSWISFKNYVLSFLK